MRVLIAECMQEISSFNPLPSRYDDFAIEHGEAIFAQRGLNTAIGGALAVLEARSDVELVPTMAARAGSAGMLAGDDWRRLYGELQAAAAPHAGRVDALYISLHGAMGAEGEPDPEGALLEAMRADVRPGHPDRHITRSARYPHRSHAAPGKRGRHLPHLPACRLRRYRPARGRAVARHRRSRPEACYRPRHRADAGARRRVHHQDRPLRRRPGRCAAART